MVSSQSQMAATGTKASPTTRIFSPVSEHATAANRVVSLPVPAVVGTQTRGVAKGASVSVGEL